MVTNKYRLPTVILSLCFIGLIGFKDTGSFVKDFTAIDKKESLIVIKKHEEVPIIKENIEGYFVQKNGITLSMPTENTIRLGEKIERYQVIQNTNLLDRPIMGNVIKILSKGDIVKIISYNDGYGLFKTEDGTQGYIKFSDVEKVKENNISYGISTVDKVIKNEDSYYTLVKDEAVLIKDFKDNHYIIVDKIGKEFKIKDTYIELSRAREKVSRGNNTNISNRGELVTKIITAAYENLGKPYCSGGIGPNGFDCSGLTYSIYLNELGIGLERVSRHQANNGFKIAREDLIPGDIVLFRTSGKKIAHVGLYIGDNNMIHASSGRGRVMITNIDTSNYYNTRYVTGRRIIK